MQAPSSTTYSATNSLPPKQLQRAFKVLLALFFMWGFLTVLNDMLIPHLKEVFTLTYAEAMLVQFSFFGAYLLFSWPSSMLLQRLGYKLSMVVGLVIMAAGAASFYPAAAFHAFGLFLGALFMLGVGITLLQVAANPYVNALGPTEKARQDHPQEATQEGRHQDRYEKMPERAELFE
jgi:FHS family L-fucose permease-like MFS transporter